MRRSALWLAIFLPLPFVWPANAQIFRWVDDHGVTHYTTTPPPEAVMRDRQTFDRKGREREFLAAPPTEEDRAWAAMERERQWLDAARRAQEERGRQAALARIRQLQLTYGSPDEIIQHRDRRLARVRSALGVSETTIEILELDRARILDEVERRRQIRLDPGPFQAQIDDLNRRIAREHEEQDRQRVMMAEIQATAARDLNDYLRLYIPGTASPFLPPPRTCPPAGAIERCLGWSGNEAAGRHDAPAD